MILKSYLVINFNSFLLFFIHQNTKMKSDVREQLLITKVASETFYGPDEEHVKEQYVMPRNNYWNRSGCCSSLTSRRALSFEEICIDLFWLVDPRADEADTINYFESCPKAEFIDLMEQLAMISEY